MRETERGFAPVRGFLEKQLFGLPQFHDPREPPLTTPSSRYGARIRFEVLEYEPLLDSSNMAIENWVQIAEDIAHHYHAFDGFVVLHGTDTMAYTASALSFMLENLGKPVVLTGSQIPLAQLKNDAVDNLLDALTLAGLFEIPEVGLHFHHRLLRGNRAQKVDAVGLDAFASANYPPLAEVGIEVDIDWDVIRHEPEDPFRVEPHMNPNVAALRLYPGLTERVLDNFLQPPLAGLVLETYGMGNGPDQRPALLEVLTRGTERGIVIVNVSQCMRGAVRPSYAAGKALADAGVVSGHDMTPEAALTKLSWLLGSSEVTEVRAAIQRDLRGELTVRKTGRTRERRKPADPWTSPGSGA
ncbi:MAG: type I asparaginase [Myxococcales bacterium]|nr:type I asparaginase [Myxococcales bacterium]